MPRLRNPFRKRGAPRGDRGCDRGAPRNHRGTSPSPGRVATCLESSQALALRGFAEHQHARKNLAHGMAHPIPVHTEPPPRRMTRSRPGTWRSLPARQSQGTSQEHVGFTLHDCRDLDERSQPRFDPRFQSDDFTHLRSSQNFGIPHGRQFQVF
jgi:hypothetical protein